jgi:hypothetical protein
LAVLSIIEEIKVVCIEIKTWVIKMMRRKKENGEKEREV